MADFRNIHTRIWTDAWFCELSLDEKVLFIYLFSNPNASVCGMYEMPKRNMALDTGISITRVSEILDNFSKAGKAHYQNGIVWVVNLKKYNDSGDSAKIKARIIKDVAAIPDCEMKAMYCETEEIPYLGKKIPYFENDSETETDRKETETLAQEARVEETPFDDPIPEEVKNPGAYRALQKFEARQVKGEKDYSWLPENFRPMAQAFYKASGIDPTSRERGLWHKSLLELYEMQATPADIEGVTSKMRRNRLTIKSPMSIVATVRDYITSKTHDGERWNE